jgi:hypothetical protein
MAAAIYSCCFCSVRVVAYAYQTRVIAGRRGVAAQKAARAKYWTRAASSSADIAGELKRRGAPGCLAAARGKPDSSPTTRALLSATPRRSLAHFDRRVLGCRLSVVVDGHPPTGPPLAKTVIKPAEQIAWRSLARRAADAERLQGWSVRHRLAQAKGLALYPSLELLAALLTDHINNNAVDAFIPPLGARRRYPRGCCR